MALCLHFFINCWAEILGCGGKAGTVGDKTRILLQCCLVLIWVTGWAGVCPNGHWEDSLLQNTHTLSPTCNRFSQGHTQKGAEVNFDTLNCINLTFASFEFALLQKNPWGKRPLVAFHNRTTASGWRRFKDELWWWPFECRRSRFYLNIDGENPGLVCWLYRCSS